MRKNIGKNKIVKSELVFVGVIVALAVVNVFLYNSDASITGNLAKVEKGGITCVDSDGEYVFEESYLIRGSTNRTRTDTGVLFDSQEDFCIGNTFLKEYYCIGRAQIRTKTYKCENGCKNGLCNTTEDIGGDFCLQNEVRLTNCKAGKCYGADQCTGNKWVRVV